VVDVPPGAWDRLRRRSRGKLVPLRHVVLDRPYASARLANGHAVGVELSAPANLPQHQAAKFIAAPERVGQLVPDFLRPLAM